MGANTTDVVVMDSYKKGMLLYLVVGVSIAHLRKQRKKIMASPKTHKVLLPDGTEARAVRLRAGNHLSVLNWIPDAEFRERVAAKTGQTSEQRLMVPIDGTKRVKAAYYDDWIVKVGKTFRVVKFNESEREIFFINSFEDAAQGERAFNKWAKEIKTLAKGH